MFKNLDSLSYVRTKKEAAGFYIAWFAFAVLFAMVAGGIGGVYMPDFESGYSLGLKIGAVLSIIICGTLTLILSLNRKIGIFSTGIYLVGTLALAAIFGALLGLVIPAYLTTRIPKGVMAESVDAVS